MILTTKENLNNYAAVHPRFAAAFAGLAALAAKPFEAGRFEIDGDKVFINVMEFDTHPEDGALMEGHRNYIDIMWIVAGEEQIGACPVDALTKITTPYDASRDILFGEIPAGATTYLQMKTGCVCVLFPEDAHAPGLDSNGTKRVRKMVAKVRIA